MQAPHRNLNPRDFEGRIDQRPVFLTQLRNANGAQVSVCNYGARVVQMLMPNAQGKLGDVALGFDGLPA